MHSNGIPFTTSQAPAISYKFIYSYSEICGTTRRWYRILVLLLVSAAAKQLSVAGAACTKKQYGGCNPQEVKVYSGCAPHEINVLRVPPACCKSVAGVSHSKLHLAPVEPAGETYFMRGALKPHTRCRPPVATDYIAHDL
jgi:hypothetical protein